jgi:hypothetical protein
MYYMSTKFLWHSCLPLFFKNSYTKLLTFRNFMVSLSHHAKGNGQNWLSGNFFRFFIGRPIYSMKKKNKSLPAKLPVKHLAPQKRPFNTSETNFSLEKERSFKKRGVETHSKFSVHFHKSVQTNIPTDDHVFVVQPPSKSALPQGNWLQFWLGIALTFLISLIFFLLNR